MDAVREARLGDFNWLKLNPPRQMCYRTEPYKGMHNYDRKCFSGLIILIIRANCWAVMRLRFADLAGFVVQRLLKLKKYQKEIYAGMISQG